MSEVSLFEAECLESMKLIHKGSSNQVQLRTYRDLRTRIQSQVSGGEVCLVVSPVTGGGASTVVKNLAATFVLDPSKSALVIDCNFYTPSLDQLLPVQPELGLLGLTDYLSDESVAIEDIIYASGVARLRVTPAGGDLDSGTEKILSNRMRHFLSSVKSRYSDRVVFVDAPPANKYSAEVRVLASLCDCVLIVVPKGKVSDGDVQKSLELVDDPSKIIGTVLNNVRF